MKIPVTLACLVLLIAAPALSQEIGEPRPHAIVELPGAIEWQPAPASLPDGAQVVVLDGDPSQEGPFTMRLRMPDGYRIPPHFHPSAERVTVISGTFRVGMGESFDDSAATALGPGAYAALAPGVAHFARADGETVIQLNNTGPWTLTYVHPEDDPRTQRD